jgi:hypothetical protein
LALHSLKRGFRQLKRLSSELAEKRTSQGFRDNFLFGGDTLASTNSATLRVNIGHTTFSILSRSCADLPQKIA